jgi:inner membrane protein YidH
MIRSYSDHAANERTFLAWVRTGLSAVALGIVVEKGSLISLVMAGASSPILAGSSRNCLGNYGGAVLVGIGVTVMLGAGVRFIRNILRIDDQNTYSADVVRLASTLLRRSRREHGRLKNSALLRLTERSG